MLSSDVRELVQRRAQGACEYCRLPQDASILPHQVDHIIGRQHRGSDEAANLCLCCIRCNLKKGPNIASIDPDTGIIVALYHPRRDSWREHFSVVQKKKACALSIRVLQDWAVAHGVTTIELCGDCRPAEGNELVITETVAMDEAGDFDPDGV